MRTAGSLIFRIFKDLGMEDKIMLEAIRKEWHNLFNEPLSLHTWPVELNSGELLINVDSPVWLQQLKFFKQDITTKLRAFDVKTIRFKHGSVFQGKTRNAESGSQDTKAKTRPLTDSDMEWIEQTIASIEDTEVRENARKALEKSLMRRK